MMAWLVALWKTGRASTRPFDGTQDRPQMRTILWQVGDEATVRVLEVAL